MAQVDWTVTGILQVDDFLTPNAVLDDDNGDGTLVEPRSLAGVRVAIKGSLFDKEKKIEGRRRRFMGDAEEIASDIRNYRAAGVDTMIFDVRRASSAETLDRMEWMAKEVIAKV